MASFALLRLYVSGGYQLQGSLFRHIRMQTSAREVWAEYIRGNAGLAPPGAAEEFRPFVEPAVKDLGEIPFTPWGCEQESTGDEGD